MQIEVTGPGGPRFIEAHDWALYASKGCTYPDGSPLGPQPTATEPDATTHSGGANTISEWPPPQSGSDMEVVEPEENGEPEIEITPPGEGR